MSEYIKREDVIDLLEQVINAEEFFDTDNAKAQSDLALWFEERISELPKADIVEVVRCKDCKHYSHDVDANEGEWDCCRVYGMFVDPNDFCSEGERKDGTK